MDLSVFVLVYGCWVECRAAARVLLTRSHISSAELASDNGEKGGWGRGLRIKGGKVERALEKKKG